ncbi:MAG: glycosyltransferase family 39 protein [Candidatus Altiarchaeota archaeon]|nr:glycosyltransferase family 39 protein [Candidatus Altiarchaeota archaeon]
MVKGIAMVCQSRDVAFERLAVGSFFLIFLLIGLEVFRDYGLSTDEVFNREKGFYSFYYVFNGDNSLLTYYRRDYGVAIELPLVIIEKAMGLSVLRDVYFMRHLCTFLFFYVSVFFFYLLCRRFFGSWKLALLGCVFLVVSPRIFADSFYNSKDIGFMSALLISTYTFFRFLEHRSLPWLVFHAFASAFAICTRIAGLFIALLSALFLALDGCKKRTNEEGMPIHISLISYAMLSSLFVMMLWPYLWSNTASHFAYALKSSVEFTRFNETFLYRGEYIDVYNRPWHYIPLWMVITIPVTYTALFIIGFSSSVFSLVKNPLGFLADRGKRDELIVILMFSMPVIAVLALNLAVYGGWRHLFFIYPSFVILALMGLRRALSFIRSRFSGRAYRLAMASFLAVILLDVSSVAAFMVRSHPYQNVYFNQLVGGVQSVKGYLEYDMWGISYREAIEYIMERDKSELVEISVDNWPGGVNQLILKPDDRKRIRYVDQKYAKYFLTNFRWGYDYNYTNEFYAIEVDGAKIMVVYKLRD